MCACECLRLNAAVRCCTAYAFLTRYWPHLYLHELGDKPAGAESDFDLHSTIGWNNALGRLDCKGRIGLNDGDLILKVNWHVACQVDTLDC